MRIVFMGTPDFAVSALDAVYRAGHEIVSVITMPDKPKGRKGEPAPTPVKELAMSLGLEVYQPASLKSDGVYEYLRSLKPDVIVVSAYGKIVPKRILELP